MRVLALDISSKTGWALFIEGPGSKPVEYGLLELGVGILSLGEYPGCYLKAAHFMADKMRLLAGAKTPDVIVIEEINLGKNRYSQRFLEWTHCVTVQALSNYQVKYVNSSAWRKTLNLSLSKEDKKNNGKLSKATKAAEIVGQKLDKKVLGIRGRIGKKHLSVRYVNEKFDLKFKMKDNDMADAICLGAAYLLGADICDGQ